MVVSGRLSILCLEDDPHVRSTLQSVLRQHEVDVALRVEQARARLSERRYDGLIFDVHLDDGSGLDLLASVRASGVRSAALVITGLDEHELANRAQELDAEFLFKPFGRAGLEGFVQRAADAKRREATSLEAAVDRLAERYALPRREHEIVAATLRGVSRAQLPTELGVSDNTLKTRIRRLLARTERDSLDDLLRAVLRGDA